MTFRLERTDPQIYNLTTEKFEKHVISGPNVYPNDQETN